jgi:pterin-4a-carbinolamine dehydratase
LAQFIEETSDERARNRDSGIYPANPPPGGPDPIADEKLKEVLSSDLKDWVKLVSPLPEDQNLVREELYKPFKFRSFQEAVHFMNQVAPGCDIAMHHPRWENIWKTLKVYLSTWDVGHKISDRDIQLARYFDRAYAEFPGAIRKKRSRKEALSEQNSVSEAIHDAGESITNGPWSTGRIQGSTHDT